MLFRPLLATLLAALPSGVLAFDDMDCVGTEICSDEECTPSFLVYTLDFDWPAGTLAVDFEGTALAMTLIDAPDDFDDTATHHVADGPNETGLWLTFNGEAIEMELFIGNDVNREHLAICAAREAA